MYQSWYHRIIRNKYDFAEIEMVLRKKMLQFILQMMHCCMNGDCMWWCIVHFDWNDNLLNKHTEPKWLINHRQMGCIFKCVWYKKQIHNLLINYSNIYLQINDFYCIIHDIVSMCNTNVITSSSMRDPHAHWKVAKFWFTLELLIAESLHCC